MDHLCFLCLVFLMLSCLFIAALWSPAGKGLTSWLLLVMFILLLLLSPCGILGQVWYLIVSFPDFCHLSYFASGSLDLIVSTSSGLILQICLSMALSLCCGYVLANGQVSLAWSMALSTKELTTWPQIL